ncbi:MAG: tRNA pseudouridine(38-40) synthase TruA [Pseudomonadales bacterium]|jgi:tRNA pseudouridine38-40 synthase|nr:tRNA pseudouridine(38-40) synthase TruA [Pseudomonadales bacterium]
METLAVPAPAAHAARRIALCVEYNGAAFRGWQAQVHQHYPTVQEALESVLAGIAAHPLRVNCAGRTDAGVHATWQIVHFDTPAQRPLKAWVRGANSRLPPQVAVRWAQEVDAEFHARFSALSRRYRYVIHNQSARAARLAELVASHGAPLDAERMHEAGQYLLGENDFSAFRGASCQSRTPMRRVMELTVKSYGGYICLDIEANAFLLHMVRNIVGALLWIGDGRRDPSWMKTLLDSRDRTQAAPTAPPQGLTLIAVRYPAHFGLPIPDTEAPPFF